MKDFLWFVGGLLLGLFLGYFAFLYFNEQQLTSATLASWVGALSTLGAAAATLLTLLFLNRQHKQNVQQQNLMWSKQEAALDFARYRDHRQQFEQLLDDLEKDHRDFYVFEDRAKLYTSLFPMNTPRSDYSSYKYKLDANDLIGEHPLENAYHWLREHHNFLDSYQEKLDLNATPLSVFEYDTIVRGLAACIHLQCSRQPETGDITIGNIVFANIFEPTLMMDRSARILHAINEFCGLEHPALSSNFYSSTELGFGLYAQTGIPNVTDCYSAKKGEEYIVEILYQSQKLCEVLDNPPAFAEFLFDEMHFDTNPNRLRTNLDDREAVLEFINALEIQLHRLSVPEPRPECLRRLTTLIHDAKNPDTPPF